MRTLLPFVLRYQLLVSRRPEWHAPSCGLHPSQFPFRQSTRNKVSRFQLIRLATSPYWHRGLTRRGPETKQSLIPMKYCPWHAEKHLASRRKLMPDRLPIRQSPFGQCGEPNPTQPQCDPSHGRTADRSPAVPEPEAEATPLRTSRLARAQRRTSWPDRTEWPIYERWGIGSLGATGLLLSALRPLPALDTVLVATEIGV